MQGRRARQKCIFFVSPIQCKLGHRAGTLERPATRPNGIPFTGEPYDVAEPFSEPRHARGAGPRQSHFSRGASRLSSPRGKARERGVAKSEAI